MPGDDAVPPQLQVGFYNMGTNQAAAAAATVAAAAATVAAACVCLHPP